MVSALWDSRVDEAQEFRINYILSTKKSLLEWKGRECLAFSCWAGHLQCGIAKVFIKRSWLKSVSNQYLVSLFLLSITKWQFVRFVGLLETKHRSIWGYRSSAGEFHIIQAKKAITKINLLLHNHCFFKCWFRKWGFPESWIAADPFLCL